MKCKALFNVFIVISNQLRGLYFFNKSLITLWFCLWFCIIFDIRQDVFIKIKRYNKIVNFNFFLILNDRC